MQRLGNEVITLISHWLHWMWNFSIDEILRLAYRLSGNITILKLVIIVLVVALVGGLFWFLARQIVELVSRIIEAVVYVVLAFFLVGVGAWGINELIRVVPNDVAWLH